MGSGGSGYTSPPGIIITFGGGSGAIAVATLSGTSVNAIIVTQPGSGYTGTPTITFLGGGGTGASAGAVTTSGTTVVISGIAVTAGGSGYTSPTVTISGGGGSSATGTATVGYPAGWNVTWGSPNIFLSNPGTGGSTVVSANPSWTGYGSGYAGGPYMMSPLTPGWTNYNSFFATGLVSAEFVTSAPHNLKTGQFLMLSGSSSFNVSSGPNLSLSYPSLNLANLTAYVTGPTTFCDHQ